MVFLYCYCSIRKVNFPWKPMINERIGSLESGQQSKGIDSLKLILDDMNWDWRRCTTKPTSEFFASTYRRDITVPTWWSSLRCMNSSQRVVHCALSLTRVEKLFNEIIRQKLSAVLFHTWQRGENWSPFHVLLVSIRRSKLVIWSLAVMMPVDTTQIECISMRTFERLKMLLKLRWNKNLFSDWTWNRLIRELSRKAGNISRLSLGRKRVSTHL